MASLIGSAGGTAIDLIDGDRLCELLKQNDLGVRTATRTAEDVSIDAIFFSEIRRPPPPSSRHAQLGTPSQKQTTPAVWASPGI
jgi:hypothetical protein